MGKKFIMSYSCGKDSTLALYRMVQNGHIPVVLLVTVDKNAGRSWFHGVPQNLL
ncbi:MAG: ATP-binding protein, partial [Bacilli bacterium]